VKKTRIIEAFNVSPRSFYEGSLLRNRKGVVQVNMPNGDSEDLAGYLKTGDRVTADAEAEKPRGIPEHDVFRLARLMQGASCEVGKENRSHPFSGYVRTLNYALRGEVNVGIPDSGDFLHLKPEGARHVGLTAGMKVEGFGTIRPMVGGRRVIGAEEVNGVGMRQDRAKEAAAKRLTPALATR
jgi:hypothetical protein